jgi:hypothetical protein
MQREQAETLALQALAWLASDPDRLGGFMALTGLGPTDLRASAADPQFLAGVLDHLLGDETALTAFADWAGIEPTAPAIARRALPGAAPEY